MRLYAGRIPEQSPRNTTMDKTVSVTVRFEYGNERIFPVNETALQVAKLMVPRKTFTVADLDILQSLGFQIEYIGDTTNATPVIRAILKLINP